jgi:hypothetical protein
MGLRSDLDDVEKIQFLTLQGLEFRPVKPVASRYTECAIPAVIAKKTTMKLRAKERSVIMWTWLNRASLCTRRRSFGLHTNGRFLYRLIKYKLLKEAHN